MRIGKISHARCGEPAATTYVAIPDEMTDEEYRDKVRRASIAYQNLLDEKNPDEPRDPRWNRYTVEDLRKMDGETTVTELITTFDQEKTDYNEWLKIQLERRRSFGEHLKDQGLSTVQTNDDYVETHVNWGHRHGVKIRYDGIIYRDSWEEDE